MNQVKSSSAKRTSSAIAFVHFAALLVSQASAQEKPIALFDGRTLDGHIGIQVHSGGKTLVEVKDVTIRRLPPTPGSNDVGEGAAVQKGQPRKATAGNTAFR